MGWLCGLQLRLTLAGHPVKEHQHRKRTHKTIATQSKIKIHSRRRRNSHLERSEQSEQGLSPAIVGCCCRSRFGRAFDHCQTNRQQLVLCGRDGTNGGIVSRMSLRGLGGRAPENSAGQSARCQLQMRRRRISAAG